MVNNLENKQSTQTGRPGQADQAPNLSRKDRIRKGLLPLGLVGILVAAGVMDVQNMESPKSAPTELSGRFFAREVRVQPGSDLSEIAVASGLPNTQAVAYNLSQTIPKGSGGFIQPGGEVLLPLDSKAGTKVEVPKGTVLPEYIPPTQTGDS